MPKYILGGGLVALLAREILGPSWTIIPHGSSRYYGFNPAIADDVISVSVDKTDFELLGTKAVRPFTRAFSLGGQLNFAPTDWMYDLYTEKVYGAPSPHYKSVTPLWQAVSEMSASQLYQRLLQRHLPELTANMLKYGYIKTIANGVITTTTGMSLDYDRILSTIPLDALYNALGIVHQLQSKDVWVYNITTDQLDFEGAEQALVVDKEFDFYKVNQIGPMNYIFFCLEQVLTPTVYFGAFLGNKLRVENPAGTKHKSFIPIGGPFTMGHLTALNIECVGSHAEWDDCVDVGTSLIRLLKIEA